MRKAAMWVLTLLVILSAAACGPAPSCTVYLDEGVPLECCESAGEPPTATTCRVHYSPMPCSRAGALGACIHHERQSDESRSYFYRGDVEIARTACETSSGRWVPDVTAEP